MAKYTLQEKLSPSAINTWDTCPFQFFCHYLDKREQIKTPDTTSFGTAIHNIHDHYYDLIDINTQMNDVPTKIEEAYTELGNYATQKRKTATRKCQSSLKRFEYERIRKKYGMPTIREKMFTAKISGGLPLIYGKPDLYFDDVGLIVDWKTGKCRGLNDSLKIQGHIYKLILEANGYHPKKVVFDYVAYGRRIILPKVSTEWVRMKIEEIVSSVNMNRFPKIKSPLCTKWCGYRLDCDLDKSCPWVIP